VIDQATARPGTRPASDQGLRQVRAFNPESGAGCLEQLPESRGDLRGRAVAIISRAPRGNAEPILTFPSASRRIINLHDRTITTVTCHQHHSL